MMTTWVRLRAKSIFFTALLLTQLGVSALRADTSLYVSDSGIGYSRIQRYDTNGAPGDYTYTTGLGRASSMVVDGTGYLYAAFGFTSSGQVRKYSPDLVDLGVFSSNNVSVLAIDKAGYLYGAFGSSIMKISPAGVATPFADDTNGPPIAMVLDGSGNLYAANHDTHSVQKFDPNGADLGIFANTGGLAFPTGMTIDSAGYLFVAVGSAQEVFKFGLDGSYDSSFAYGNMVAYPTSMTIDSGDSIYIQGQDTWHSIYRFASDGSRQIVVGGGLGSIGALALSEVPEPSVVVLSLTGLSAARLCRFRLRRR